MEVQLVDSVIPGYPQATFRANAVGTFNVLEVCRACGVERMLFASSIGTYADGLTDDHLDDLTLQRPRLFYGAWKLFGENKLRLPCNTLI